MALKKIFLHISGWQVLFWVATIFSIGFCSQAVWQLYQFGQLDRSTKAHTIEWSVEELSPSAFALGAQYTFFVDGKAIDGETRFRKPYYLNQFAAQKEIQERKKRSWPVFYNKKRPAVSSLEKVFPLKSCLYAIMTVGISLYFLILKKISASN